MKTARVAQLVYTFARTPSWAASNAYGGCTVNSAEGGCRPPANARA